MAALLRLWHCSPSPPTPSANSRVSLILPFNTGKPEVWHWRFCHRWGSSSKHGMHMLAVGNSRWMSGTHLRMLKSISQVSRACSDAQLQREVGTVGFCSLLAHNSESRQAKSRTVAEWCWLYSHVSPRSLYLGRSSWWVLYCYHGIKFTIITRVPLFLKQTVLRGYAGDTLQKGALGMHTDFSIHTALGSLPFCFIICLVGGVDV